MNAIFWIFYLLAAAGLAFIPANMARKKGYSYGGFWCLSFFVSFLVGIIVAACIPDKSVYARQGGSPQGRYAVFCEGCGKPLGLTDEFCSVCGRKAPEKPQSAAYPYQTQAATYTVTEPEKNSFVDTYLGFVILGSLLFVSFILLSITGRIAFSVINLTNIIYQVMYYAVIALAIALTTRAKGPDFSIGSIAGFSMVIIALIVNSSGSIVMGVFLAILVSAIIGLVNGTVTVLLKVPSFIATLVMASIITGMAYMLSGGKVIEFTHSREHALIGFITLIIVFAAAFLINMFTGLGVPYKKRAESNIPAWTNIIAYILSGVIAALGGFVLLIRIGAATPNISSGLTPFILFTFVCVISSRALDNKIFPILFALAPALIWGILFNAFAIMGLASYVQSIVTGIITLAFTAVVYIARSREFKDSLLPR